jgi:hypothetical protein
MVVINDGQFIHRLMHNSSFSRSNGSVQEGDEVAKVGTTGLSTGPHCHWDINDEGTYPTSFAAFKDPYRWLQGEYKPVVLPEPKLEANQRLLSNPTGVNQRAAPNTSAAIIKEWPYDQEPFTFSGYIKGEEINGNNTWFIGALSGGYFSSVAFKGGADITGLKNLNAPITPAPTPTPLPTFTAELSCVTAVRPAHPTNYETSNFPANPTGVVLHDFGTDGVDTFTGSLAHFQKPETTAPHFTVSGKQKIQNGKLSWRMYHAGPQGNDKIGIEIDPDVDTNPDTKRSVLEVLAELDAKYGPLTRYLHSQFMATSCGDDITKANLLIPPAAPTSPKDDEQDKRLASIEELVKRIADFLESIFKGFKR